MKDVQKGKKEKSKQHEQQRESTPALDLTALRGW